MATGMKLKVKHKRHHTGRNSNRRVSNSIRTVCDPAKLHQLCSSGNADALIDFPDSGHPGEVERSTSPQTKRENPDNVLSPTMGRIIETNSAVSYLHIKTKAFATDPVADPGQSSVTSLSVDRVKGNQFFYRTSIAKA